MSTWDEKAEDYASAHHTLKHQRLAYNMRQWGMFVKGARWQREQLLSEETVERTARRISERRQCGDCDLGGSPVVCSSCWEDAMAVLTAALGEEK